MFIDYTLTETAAPSTITYSLSLAGFDKPLQTVVVAQTGDAEADLVARDQAEEALFNIMKSDARVKVVVNGQHVNTFRSFA